MRRGATRRGKPTTDYSWRNRRPRSRATASRRSRAGTSWCRRRIRRSRPIRRTACGIAPARRRRLMISSCVPAAKDRSKGVLTGERRVGAACAVNLQESGACGEVIELGLQRGHALARLVELFAGALELQLQTRDPLLEFNGLFELELIGSRGWGRSGESTTRTHCGMSVNRRLSSCHYQQRPS
jgi:hypothetical protein